MHLFNNADVQLAPPFFLSIQHVHCCETFPYRFEYSTATAIKAARFVSAFASCFLLFD